MEIVVDVLGTRARQIISQDHQATVSGATSRGLFVSTRSGFVLFLSVEKFRGPLTLNLKTTEKIFEGIQPGDLLEIRDRNLFFSTRDLWISADEAKQWKPNDPASAILSPSERQRQLNEVCNQIPIQSGSFDTKRLESLYHSIHSRDEIRLVGELKPFLGHGIGLTPAGDDMIVGLLLTLNRWGSFLFPGLRLDYIDQAIARASRQRTTALSANLIECAAQAQADERLILALDSLVTGKPDLLKCVTCLRGYGSSSGIDAFNGMAIAFTT